MKKIDIDFMYKKQVFASFFFNFRINGCAK